MNHPRGNDRPLAQDTFRQALRLVRDLVKRRVTKRFLVCPNCSAEIQVLATHGALTCARCGATFAFKQDDVKVAHD